MTNPLEEYEKRFANHPVHTTLRELVALVDGASKLARIGEGAQSKLFRLQAGIENVQRSLSAMAGWLVGAVILKELYRSAGVIKESLTAYVNTAGGDEAQLNAANDNFDNQLLPILQKFPRPESPIEAAALVEQVGKKFLEIDEEWKVGLTQWHRRADESEADMRKSAESIRVLNEQVQVVQDRLAKIVERSDSAVAEINAKAAEAEAQRAKTAIEAESLRAQRFDSHILKVQKNLADETESFREAAGKSEARLSHEASAILERLTAHERQASELLQLIGNKGVTAPFKTTADTDRRVAFWLRLAAAGCFLGLVAVVIFVAVDVHIATENGVTFDWGRVMFRILTGVILSVPAYYFAREAAKFQSESDRNRRMQLELASLGPFIEHLDQIKRDALKEELTRRYFGTPHVAPELEKPIELKDMLGLLRIALRRK